MSRKYIEEGWKSFEAAAVPREAGPHQRYVQRGTFYAGAMWLFRTLTREISDGEEITADDDSVMESIDREIRVFMATVHESAERVRERERREGAK